MKSKSAVPLVWPEAMVTFTEAGAVKSVVSAVSAAMDTVRAAAEVKAGAPSGSAAFTVTVRVVPSSTWFCSPASVCVSTLRFTAAVEPCCCAETIRSPGWGAGTKTTVGAGRSTTVTAAPVTS